jgi:uncharacterized protein (DUF2249 family)
MAQISHRALIRIKAICENNGYRQGVPQESIRELDVRNLFADKVPPLRTNLNAVDELKAGEALCLLVPFEPTPLYALLASQGFSHEASQNPDGSWRVVFRR